ncbi:MAG: radical SAM protein [Anaerolineae bacterium]|nr:radical SAM protein [Anaerolineae bacterium]
MGDCACHTRDLNLRWEGNALAFAFLELTPACNNHCVGCSNVFSNTRLPPPLSGQQWRELIARLEPHVGWLKLTGGEPTLHPAFEELIDYLGRVQVSFRLLTNGRWENRPRTLRVLAANTALESLLISLHGPDAESHEAFTQTPGSFVDAVVTIQDAVRAGLVVALSTVLTAHNWQRVEEMVQYGLALGVDHLAFNRYIGPPLPDAEPTPEQLATALQDIERLWVAGYPVRFGTPAPQCLTPNHTLGCLAGRAFVTIDPWGKVRPCNHEPRIIGDLQATTLDEILQAPALEAWLHDIPADCGNCLERDTCGGGCRAERTLRGARLGYRRQPSLIRANPVDAFV